MRYLSGRLQAVLESRNRQPAFKIYVWDPSTVTISQIASARTNFDSSNPDPFNLTDYCSDINWTDKQLSFNLVDPAVLFHPDFGTYKNYLKDGAIVRLVEGDEQVPEDDWITTFTGQIHGQVGWKTNRSSAQMVAKISAFGRAETQAFKRRRITTKEYTVGSDIGIAVMDICSINMGLTHAEMRIPDVLGRQFKHKVNQLSQVAPWDGISSILEVVCYIPFFDGEGRLSYINKNLQRVPDKIYPTTVDIIESEVPENSQDAINKVRVTFLDSELSKVPGPSQKLSDAQVTSGFFSMSEKLETWWSDDHKQRAENSSMHVIKSVNSGILPVGTESYHQIDEFHGEIRVAISVWVPILATVMALEYVAAALIPDQVIVFGIGASTGITIPWGRILQAQAMLGIMLIMMSIGSAQYQVWGEPFDYAYLEKQSIAILDGLDYWLENEKEIKNDFIGTHDQADVLAVTELIWEQVHSKPRRVIMVDDPSLEPGDIIVLSDGRQIVIDGLSKTIKRGEVPTLSIDGGKVLAY